MPALTDEQRAIIGVESEPRAAAYPVNEIMAQFFCEMVEDANPIYFDEGYARSTWLKGKFAPPAMLLIWRMAPVWPPRDEAANPVAKLGLEEAGSTATIAVNAAQEYFQPLRYGDTLSVTARVAGVSEEKTTRLGTGHFVTTLDTYRNQHGQVVGTHSFTLFVYAPAGQEQGTGNMEHGTGGQEPKTEGREPRAQPPALDGTSRVPGSMFQASTSPGAALPAISIDLTLRRAVQAVAGTRDYYPFHHDEQWARENGAEGIFFNTMFLQAFAGRAACEWFGNDAILRRMEIAMRGSNYVGKTLTAEGIVAEVRQDGGRTLVEVDCTLRTEDGPTTGVKFTVELPPS